MILGPATYTVTRPGPRSVVDGEISYDSAEELTVYGSLQPLSGMDLQRIEEGDRTTATHKLYTKTVLNVGDLVEVEGTQHRVITVQKYGHRLSHTKAVLSAPGEDSL